MISISSRFQDLNLKIQKEKIVFITSYDDSSFDILNDFCFNDNLKIMKIEELFSQDVCLISLRNNQNTIPELIKKIKKCKKVIVSMKYRDEDVYSLLKEDIPVFFSRKNLETIEIMDIKNSSIKFVANIKDRSPQHNLLKDLSKKYFSFLGYEGEVPLYSYSPWIFDLPISLDGFLRNLNLNGKKINRLIYEKTFDKVIDISILNTVFLLAKLNINYNRIVDFLFYNKKINPLIFEHNIDKVISLLSNFNENRIINLIQQKEINKSVFYLDLDYFCIKNCKNWSDIFFNLKKFNEYKKNGVIKLNQRKFKDKNIYSPGTNIDLFHLGIYFNNCLIKDFGYLEKILKKEIEIFKYRNYCIGIKENNVIIVENKNDSILDLRELEKIKKEIQDIIKGEKDQTN